MFREMRRKKQQISDEVCVEVLKQQPRGVLSIIGDDGYPLTNLAVTEKVCRHLCRKFTDDKEYEEKEIKHALPRVLCLELTPEHMAGKLVNES